VRSAAPFRLGPQFTEAAFHLFHLFDRERVYMVAPGDLIAADCNA
jgi:hypothetical protein